MFPKVELSTVNWLTVDNSDLIFSLDFYLNSVLTKFYDNLFVRTEFFFSKFELSTVNWFYRSDLVLFLFEIGSNIVL